MEEDSTIIHLRQPGLISDLLTEIAREGAQRMLAAALKAEADSFVEAFSRERLPDGRQRIVRHGVGPERVIQTGIGPIIGATPEGKKELVGFHVGARESAQSWRELLVDLKARGLTIPPELAVGDGALGFWKAMEEIYPATRHQRCWFHKISNILGKFPTSMAAAVKSDLQEIHHAETKAAARGAIDVFNEKYAVKYASAVTCLIKDEEALLAFYDFPAEHWDHLRTSNPIESVFATVRHRTVRTKGALSQKTVKIMVFTLIRAASKTWRRLKGANQLPP
jgi:putative transposase